MRDMEKVFINADAKEEVKAIPEEIPEGKALGLVTTVQFLKQLPRIKEKIPGSIVGGQILGCDIKQALRIDEQVDAFLYIGTGRFHPLTIKRKTGKEVYCLNPETGHTDRITHEEIKESERREKAGLAAFHSASKVGIIVTTKHGQQRLKDALELKTKLEKKSYIFMAETIDLNDFENYELDCLVNTACPRLVEDESPRPIINIDRVTS